MKKLRLTILYATGGPYDMFGGQDATRGLATFNMKVKDTDDDLCDLEERHWVNVARWEKQFTGTVVQHYKLNNYNITN